MALHESGEDYLEAILLLTKKNGYARSIDVAGFLSVSKPSVSRAMSILKADGYIEVPADGRLLLTDTGMEIAETILERHVFITDFLESLGVERDTAAADACKIEHVLSDETYDKLRKFAEDHIKK